jgi:hypothetical protein
MENKQLCIYPNQGNINGNLEDELEKLNLHQESIWGDYSQPSSMRGSDVGYAAHQFDETHHYSPQQDRLDGQYASYGYDQNISFGSNMKRRVPNRHSMGTISPNEFMPLDGRQMEFSNYHEYQNNNPHHLQIENMPYGLNAPEMGIHQQMTPDAYEGHTNNHMAGAELISLPQNQITGQKVMKRSYGVSTSSRIISKPNFVRNIV